MIELFHFLRPEWLWALIPFVIGVLLWYRREGKSRSWQSYCDAELLPFLMVGSEAGRSWPMMITGTMAALLTIFALAGPTWERRPQPLFRTQSAMVIALDLSLSMNATDVRPNRLERAKLKLRDVLERRREGQTGLLVFAGESFVVTPLTSDSATISAMLSSITTQLIPAGAQGSHPERVLGKAVELMQQAGMVQGDILLISDGTDERCIEQCIAAAAEVKSAGYRLSIISVGSAEGAPIPTGSGYLKDADGVIVVPKLNDLQLKNMAASGGGIFSALRGDDADIDAVLALASNIKDQEIQSSEAQSQQWYESGPWLLIVLLPLAALFYRRGILVIPLTILIMPKGGAMAAERIGSGLWYNDNQRAEQLLEAGRAEEASRLFESKKWQAVAHYRAGNFATSQKLLEGEHDPTSQYNYANALAQLGKLPEAIALYESVLEREPAHVDARHNLDLLNKMMQQNSQQQGKSESQDGESEGQKSDQSGTDKGEQPDSGDAADGSQSEQSGPSEGAQRESDQRGQQGERQSGEQSHQPGGKPGEDGEDGQSARAETAKADSEDEQKNGQGSEAQGDESTDGGQLAGRYQPQGDANAQWLRQIPDDPGGLLQRKFRYQYQQRFKDRKRDRQPW